ncbi:family 14 glycosylhydrolase [Peptostreptococcaceae bacterium AGR-M142]
MFKEKNKILEKGKKRFSALIINLIFVFFVTTSCAYENINTISNNDFTANAMSPLKITDFDEFDYQLKIASELGVDAISVDVWWGMVEQEDNNFDWSYYDEVFELIKNNNLKILPIMSFHQCGGNVGDDVNIYIPKFLFSKYTNTKYKNIILKDTDLKYVSELGNVSNEYLSLFVDNLVKNEYLDFMNDFEQHFYDYKDDFQEINISCGSAGELRYPSYNSHDSGNTFSGYPNKGYLQCYSDIAKLDFRNDMLAKYQDLEGINNAWSINLTDIDTINPPSNGQEFFYASNKPYLNSTYGQDFVDWYNDSLVEHGKNMIDYALEAFDEDFRDIKLGIKIPGVHWQINNFEYPRTAEINAGLIGSNFDSYNSYGYEDILSMVSSYGDKVVLHFTCLEMDNDNGESTSTPKDLVSWVGNSANEFGVEIKGENALNFGNEDSNYWTNIDDAIANNHYKGITILRINDVVYGNSNNYYSNLISKYKDFNFDNKNVFRVNNVTTDPSYEVYIVGNTDELGNWDVNKAVKMYNVNEDRASKINPWMVCIENLPMNQNIEFKFIIKSNDDVIWENNIPNRFINISDKFNTFSYEFNN